jgi:cysteinyl-tRNA synthetase
MASVWMHNGFLQVEGQKMSKSLGNFVTIREVLNDWPGEVVRLNMLKTHYRQPIDWTIRGLEESERELNAWYGSIDLYGSSDVTPDELVVNALFDDLNLPLALTRLRALSRYSKGVTVNEPIANAVHYGGEFGASLLRSSARLLGLLTQKPSDWFSRKMAPSTLDKKSVLELVNARLEARRAKNFAESDRIRDELLAMRIQLKDGKDPVTGEPTTTWEVKR